ncbi:LuxR family transcriptional regulator [Rhodococcus sp. W8901]|uniref:LuxR C-terminal-related transcriptional regulator n=1 Tax=Rhodococcus sp. W8901 TaxID=2742603 RepID=UPI0015837D37|nr:LuxR family transcriptional regulator [Rhodococcus sp. W8901]QKT13602.1 hypothetical protein HUN07_25190 [Rhodococcus sp. W8901]
MVIAFGMRAHGRAQAIHQIEQGLQNAAAGSGSALVVTGTRRSGRTHFLDEVYRMHEGRTAFVTGLRESDLSPLAAFLPLFTRIGVDGDALVGAIPNDRKPAVDDVGAIIGDRVLSALESFDTGEFPLLVAVDDADLLPPSCIAILGYVARRLAKLRVFVVLASGPRVDPRLQALPQLPMYTMTLAESGAFVESATGGRPPLSTIIELHRIGRGNPVDIGELCEHLTTAQLHGHSVLPKPVAVAHNRTDRWRTAFGSLTAAQRAALTVLSIAGAVEPDRLVETLRSKFGSDIDLDHEIATLVRADHIQSIRHQVHVHSHLDRAAIYTIAPPKLRVECHRVVDSHSLLRERPALAAANRVFIGEPVDMHTDEIIRRMAELAKSGEVALAIHTIRRVLDTLDTSDETHQSRLAAHALRIATSWGYFADATQFADCIEPQLLRPDEAAAAVATQLFLRYLRDERFDDEWVRNTVTALASRCPHSASTLAGVAGYLHLCRHEQEQAHLVLAAAESADLRESDPASTASLAKAHLAITDGSSELASHRLSSSAVTDRMNDHRVGSAMSAHLLQQLGRHSEAGNSLGRLSTQATSPVERTVVMTLQVDGELFAGNIDAARLLWDESQSLVPAEDCLPSLRLCQRIQILGLSGRFNEVDDLVDRIRSTPSSHAHRANESRLRWALGQIALMRGDYESSISLLEQSFDLDGQVGGHWQLQRQVDLIEVFVRSGEPEMAERVLRTLGLRLAARHSPSTTVALARGELLVAKSPEEARMALSRALGPRTAPAPTLERARAHAIYADRLRADSEVTSYRHHRRTARSLFARIGAVGWLDAARVARETSAADQPPVPSLAQLTEQENEIVALVLQGLRNHDIGRRTFISQRTVEKRLTGVFRKLGIRSRAELFAVAAAEHTEAGATSPGHPRRAG